MTANARTTVAHGNAAPHFIVLLMSEQLLTLTSCLKSPSNLESRDTLHYTQRSVWCGITLGIIFLQDVLLKLRHPQAIWYTFILFLMIINCRVQCFVVSRVYRDRSSYYSMLPSSPYACFSSLWCRLMSSSTSTLLHYFIFTHVLFLVILFIILLFRWPIRLLNCRFSFRWFSSSGWRFIPTFKSCVYQICSPMSVSLSISFVFHTSPCLPVDFLGRLSICILQEKFALLLCSFLSTQRWICSKFFFRFSCRSP